MFYFWKSGENGDLWVSGEGLRKAFSERYPGGAECSEISLLGDKELLNVSFVLDRETDPDIKNRSENSIREFASGVGIRDVQTGWVSDPSSKDLVSTRGLFRNPFLWAGTAWIFFAVFRMGISGTILATLFSASVFFLAALFTTDKGSDIRKKIRGLFEKNA
ncbi:MAG TPA: hypothetical protein P5541_07980 [Thermovirgaceae bacterium]|nr:hypothetical protein [Thermovirgaceae bacterium]